MPALFYRLPQHAVCRLWIYEPTEVYRDRPDKPVLYTCATPSDHVYIAGCMDQPKQIVLKSIPATSPVAPCVQDDWEAYVLGALYNFFHTNAYASQYVLYYDRTL